jgi:predicted transcriptional regulator of viral defense system
MISQERGLEILAAIAARERSGVTVKIWVAAQLRAQWNTGIVNATVGELAAHAGTVPAEAYRALSRLVEIGALIRTGRGRYAVNPAIAWNGALAVREKTVELTPA